MEATIIVMGATVDYVNHFIFNNMEMTQGMQDVVDLINNHKEVKKTKEGNLYLIIN